MNDLIPYASLRWRQTTNEMLRKADIIIFTSKQNYEMTKKRYRFDEKKCKIWKIDDFSIYDLIDKYENFDAEAIRRSEVIYKDISVSDLVSTINLEGKIEEEKKQYSQINYCYRSNSIWKDSASHKNCKEI